MKIYLVRSPRGNGEPLCRDETDGGAENSTENEFGMHAESDS